MLCWKALPVLAGCTDTTGGAPALWQKGRALEFVAMMRYRFAPRVSLANAQDNGVGHGILYSGPPTHPTCQGPPLFLRTAASLAGLGLSFPRGLTTWKGKEMPILCSVLAQGFCQCRNARTITARGIVMSPRIIIPQITCRVGRSFLRFRGCTN